MFIAKEGIRIDLPGCLNKSDSRNFTLSLWECFSVYPAYFHGKKAYIGKIEKSQYQFFIIAKLRKRLTGFAGPFVIWNRIGGCLMSGFTSNERT